ncbi:response regulator transcription factor [Sphingobacterium ginsenosidimutans]|uniref:UvrY/SirA/GacA family response regulator transcription factor n=2 Tax=Sphingobacterium TaxID=28453 RepID=A0ABP7ZWE4_9SPHI
MMTEILLVDDHHLVRNGIRLILDSCDDLSVVEEVGSGEEALDYLQKNKTPDLVLTDINMKEIDGIALIHIAKRKFPTIRTSVLSMVEDSTVVVDAFNAGADGYLTKGTDYSELLFGVSQVAQGKKYLSSAIAMEMVGKYSSLVPLIYDRSELLSRYEINEREFSVLELISQGLTNAEIADQIFLSKRTIEGIRQHLIDKTQTKNTADLVRFAFQNKLLE